jgi:DNA polymerase III subunit delta'
MSSAALLPWLTGVAAPLTRAEQEGRFPHALLISGAAGVGKRTLALRLAQWLLCSERGPDLTACGRCDQCQLGASGAHPDVHWISPLEDKRNIAVDQIRELTRDLVLKPLRASARAAILTPADSMNVAAQNALLKTLEEPVGTTYLLLLAANPTKLLPTVRSRCQAVQVPVPDHATAITWLTAQDPTAGGWDPVLEFVGGAPLAALALARDGVSEDLALGELLRDLEEAVIRLADGRLDPATVAARFEKVPLPLILSWIQRLLHQMALAGVGQEAGIGSLRDHRFHQLCADIDLHGLYEYADGVAALRRSEDVPLNRLLILEALFAPWGRGLELTGEQLEV